MHVTATTLADGRELLYFDDVDRGRIPSPDNRDLPPRPPLASLRYDALSNDWVSIATARQDRAFLPPADADPLAPQTPGNPSEVPDDYDVAVFENRSPSFGTTRQADSLEDPDLHTEHPAAGRCEVVCFSPENTGSFATQSTRRARTIIDAWAHRTEALSQTPGVEQVFPFENRGVEIGVTLHHPHGQIYGYPHVPKVMRGICDAVEHRGSDLFQRILDAETASPRLVLAGEHFSAFVPFAARWPVEVHLMPHRHVPDFTETTDAERDELAVLTLQLTRALDLLYDEPLPYIGAWMQAPVHEHRDDVRMHWRLTSPRRSRNKLKYLAGSESAMGAWVADLAPEAVAERMRGALERVGSEHPVEPLSTPLPSTEEV